MASLFAGCSCAPTITLSFSNNWDPQNSANFGHVETYVYDVNFATEYVENDYTIRQSAGLSNAVGINFKNGVYIMTLSVLDKTNLETNKDSTVFEGLSADYKVIRIQSLLTITSEYTPKDKPTESYEELVKTDCYMLDTKNALAPIYSYTENRFSVLSISGGETEIKKAFNSTEILYNKDSYKMIQKVFNPDTSELIDTKEENYSYTFKTIIDNNNLLFALRNVNLTQESAKTLPVVSGTYGTATDLSINYINDVNVNVNSVDYTAKRVSFARSSQSTQGQPQLVYIQTGENAKSLMVKYVTPMAEIGPSYNTLGALVYTLRS